MKFFPPNQLSEIPSASPSSAVLQPKRLRFGIRFALLLLCLVLGIIVGAVGQIVTGHTAWYLAIPVFVAVAWFAIADPTSCVPGPSGRRSDGPAL